MKRDNEKGEQKMINRKRNIVSLLTALVMAASLIGCGSEPASNNSGSTTASSDTAKSSEASENTEPAEPITAMCVYYGTGDPASEDFVKKMGEVLGAELDITMVPGTGYEDKVNTMLASNTLPRMVVISNLKSSAFVNAADAGAFWDIEPFLADYPNLQTIAEGVYSNIRVNGVLYGIPRERPVVRRGINYRLDWLEEAGISQPETVEDIAAIISNFSDREGVDYGLTQGGGYIEGLPILAVWNGAPNNWGIDENNTFVPDWFTPEFMEVLNMFRDFYANGEMNKNFAEITVPDGLIAFNTEKAGFIFNYAENLGPDTIYSDLYKINPDAKMWYGLEMKGTDGVSRAVADAGFNGMFAFPKSANPTEKELRECLTVLNNMGTEEYANLVEWGIEGSTYSIVDGSAKRTPEQAAEYEAVGAQYRQFYCFNERSKITGQESPEVVAFRKERGDYVDIAVFDLSLPYTSETNTMLGEELKTIKQDACTKYIMGAIDEAGFEKAKNSWLNAGGQAVIDEFTNAHKEANQ